MPGDDADSDMHPRVRALVARFREIADSMRNLPICNAAIAVEAIGFRPFGDVVPADAQEEAYEGALLGVLLTPWFMNVVVLPVTPVPIAMAKMGTAVPVDLPAGRRTFMVGGDEVIGQYHAHSLHSPLLEFTLPGQAQAEARRALAALMTAPAPEPRGDPAGPAAPANVDRRALLFGRRRGD